MEKMGKKRVKKLIIKTKKTHRAKKELIFTPDHQS
jgi:hypothetical protein